LCPAAEQGSAEGLQATSKGAPRTCKHGLQSGPSGVHVVKMKLCRCKLRYKQPAF